MWPAAATMTPMARPCARPTATRSMPPLAGLFVAIIDPAPTKISVKVPTTSTIALRYQSRSIWTPAASLAAGKAAVDRLDVDEVAPLHGALLDQSLQNTPTTATTDTQLVRER